MNISFRMKTKIFGFFHDSFLSWSLKVKWSLLCLFIVVFTFFSFSFYEYYVVDIKREKYNVYRHNTSFIFYVLWVFSFSHQSDRVKNIEKTNLSKSTFSVCRNLNRLDCFWHRIVINSVYFCGIEIGTRIFHSYVKHQCSPLKPIKKLFLIIKNRSLFEICAYLFSLSFYLWHHTLVREENIFFWFCFFPD